VAAARGAAAITGVADGTATSITGIGDTGAPVDESAGPAVWASSSRFSVGSAAASVAGDDDDSGETSDSGVVRAELLTAEREVAASALEVEVRPAPVEDSPSEPGREAELDDPELDDPEFDDPEFEPVEPVVSANATAMDAIAEPTPNAAASANTRPT